MAPRSPRSLTQLNQPTMRPRWVMQRLQRPSTVADRIGIEAKVAKATAACDRAQLRIVRRIDVAELRVKFVERLLQRRALLGFDAACAEPADGKSGSRTQHHRPGNEQRQQQRDARNGCLAALGGSCHRLRRALPVCRPPSPGCRGRHTQRPLLRCESLDLSRAD